MRVLNFLIAISFSSIAFAQAKVEDHISKGNDYYRQSQFDLAEKQYRLALKADPDNQVAQHNLANALYRQKKYDEANEILSDISKNGKGKYVKSSAYYNAGVISTKEKDLEGSIEAYKNALRLTPDDKEARDNLQKALLELKQRQQQRQKEQQQNQQSQSNMSQREAERRLKELQEKERKIQERMQNQQGGTPQPKDW